MKGLLLSFLLFSAAAVRAADVTGYVYAPDGAAVEGAKVTARVPVQGTVLASAVSAKDGAFVLAALPDGVVELAVEARGFAAPPLFALTSDSPLTVSLYEEATGHMYEGTTTMMVATAPMRERDRGRRAPAPTPSDGVLTGVVTLNGKPLANAPVSITGNTEQVQVVTNAKGEFRRTGLAAERFYVRADERLVPRVRAAEGPIADLTEAREAAVQLELMAAPLVRGRVVDAEGKAVPRARVSFVMTNRPDIDFAFEHGPRTTPDGRYAIAVPPWENGAAVNLAVTAPLHSTVRSKSMPLPVADRVLDIALPTFEAVKVRVADREGKGIAGARVAFATTVDASMTEGIEMLLSPGLVSRAPRTDANGAVLLRLAPDDYAFAATAKEFQTTTATKAIGREATVDLTLPRAALVRGRVRRGDSGVPGVHINILGPQRMRRENMTITNDKGEFEIGGLAPGAYRLGVFKADELIERTMEIEAPADVDIPLPPAGTIRARVIDGTTGAPVTELVYSVEPVNPEPGTRMGRGIHRGEQNADGRFVVTVPAGTYRVSASANGFTPAEPVEVRVDAREPATIDIPLSRGVIITGRVTDESGLPVSEADVMVLDAESLRGRTQRTRVAPGHGRTDADGSFTVSGVRAGEASLTVRKAGFVPWRKTLQAESTMSLDVQLTKGLTLRGIVTRGGKPVADAQISASTAAVGGEHQPASSDEEGRFVLSGLVAARYTIGAFVESDHAEVLDVDPTRQKEVAISLDPKPRGVVYGTVSGIPNTGGKIVRRTVMVQGQSNSAEGSIDEAGNYRIEDAPTGQVQVSAMVELAPRGVRAVGGPTIELVAGQPQRVDLDLAGNVAVSGRVTQSGKPISGAQVSFGTDRGTIVGAVTREDGAYDLALPEAGRYTISVSAAQLYDRAYTSVREVRGGERIDVDLRESTLDGVVLDATTRLPIPTAFVTLTPSAATTVMPIVAEVPVSPNGTFRLTTTSTGPYRLIASAQGYAHKVVAVSQASSQYTLELMPVAELRLRVLDAVTRAPLDAHITLHETDGAYVPARPLRSTDGTTYAFSLAPGTYRLTVVSQGYRNRTVEVTAPGATDVLME